MKTRIDAFLRAIHEARFEDAFAICPMETFVKGKGMVLETGLGATAIAERLVTTMFHFIEGQSVARERLGTAEASQPATWCSLITPPGEVDYEDISLDFPFESDEDDELEDAPDSTRATGEGEVLANVHLCNEVTDITGRYALNEHEGKWILAFHNFDVM